MPTVLGLGCSSAIWLRTIGLGPRIIGLWPKTFVLRVGTIGLGLRIVGLGPKTSILGPKTI